MVISSSAVIRPYLQLLKLAENPKIQKMNQKETNQNQKNLETKEVQAIVKSPKSTIDMDHINKSTDLPIEARYWDRITEEHYGCEGIANGRLLLQLIYRKVANLMGNAEQSIEQNRRPVEQADLLLTNSFKIHMDNLFNTDYYFKHDGKNVKPLNSQQLARVIKYKIKNFKKHSELSLGSGSLNSQA